MIVRASESQHWYTKTGDPAYTVKNKDGHQRPTTLRDARKLGLVPSVTTIIKCAASPGLEAWKLQQMMLAALTLPRAPEESEESFISRIQTDSKEQAKMAAERGSEVHAALESFFETFSKGLKAKIESSPEFKSLKKSAPKTGTSFDKMDNDLEDLPF